MSGAPSHHRTIIMVSIVAIIIVVSIAAVIYLSPLHNQNTTQTTSQSQTTLIQTSAISKVAPSMQLLNNSIFTAPSSTITVYFDITDSVQNYTYVTVASPGTMASELVLEQEWTAPPLPAGINVSFSSLSVTGASVSIGDDYATVEGTNHFVLPITITLSSVPSGNQTLEIAVLTGQGTASTGIIQDFTIEVSSTMSTTSTSAAPLINPSTRIPTEGQLEGQPEAIAYDPVNNLVLVVATDTSGFPFETILYVVNATTNEILYSESLGPVTTTAHSIAYDPANQEMYVSMTSLSSTSCCTTAMLPISLTTPYETLPMVNVSQSIGSALLMQFDPANNETYLGIPGANYVLALNTANEVVANITVPYLNGLAYDPLLQEMYASAGNTGVYLISANDSISAMVKTGLPGLLQFDPANGYMYVVSGQGGVTVLNGTRVVATLGTGSGTGPLSFDPQSGDLYVSNIGSDTITVIDKSDTAVATIDAAASGGVYDAKQGLMVFAGDQLFMVDSSNEITGLGNVPSPVFQEPPLTTTMVYVPTNGCVYALSPQNDSVSAFC